MHSEGSKAISQIFLRRWSFVLFHQLKVPHCISWSSMKHSQRQKSSYSIRESNYVRVQRHRHAPVVRTVNPNMKLWSSKTRPEMTSESCLVKWICLKILCDNSDLKAQSFTWACSKWHKICGARTSCVKICTFMGIYLLNKKTYIFPVWLFSMFLPLLSNCCLSQLMLCVSQRCATLCCYLGIKICKFRHDSASSTAASKIFPLAFLLHEWWF